MYKILAEEEELLNLKGNTRNVHLISLDLCKTEARIVQRGKKGVTKHFLIPIKHRSKSKKKPKNISYHALNLNNKIIFIYTFS